MPARRHSYPLVNLASAFLAGPWTLRSLISRGQRACPGEESNIRKIVRRLLASFPGNPPPFLDVLLAFLAVDPLISARPFLRMGKLFRVPVAMTPRGTAAPSWNVPALTTSGQLADWLGVAASDLNWLADVRGLTVKQDVAKMRHYVCRWQPRRRGRFRLVESPKPRLKAIQRRIVREILDRIPPHPDVHGFRRGRSILTYAAPHVGQHMVLRFDLRDFFPTVRAARIHLVFRTAGYPEEVARLLTGLCTSRVPSEVWERRPDPRESDAALGDRLRGPHLPQGAPTSPALANLCAYRLDVRLHGLAQAVGAVYTRYADDLAFSGGEMLARGARRFQVAVAVIAAEEGFAVHFQKSRFMRQRVCQQLAGIVVNERLNIRRTVYDELKAILTNCIRHGPHTQNRAAHADFRGHLLGRIAHVRMIHSQRGVKLQGLFERIVW
ncbi:MAG TPA: reverse transcriptase family protein [Gemmataceae bacterium]|jgi:RNA-directed DNA polymerase|nr:reverse transcriptase family protein [Gemmataceae bacterium]